MRGSRPAGEVLSIEVEGGERSPGTKALADRVDLGDRRRWLERPDSLDGASEREVGGRPDVSSAQCEHQHAVGGESPDALDLHQLCTGCVVVELPQPIEVEPTVDEAFSEIAEVHRLRPG
jgi:hypothetical protein